MIVGFALIEHLLRQQPLIDAPGQTLTFDYAVELASATAPLSRQFPEALAGAIPSIARQQVSTAALPCLRAARMRLPTPLIALVIGDLSAAVTSTRR
jgi:hypothetical protein